MSKTTFTVYGIGGRDPEAPDDNVVEEGVRVERGLSADPKEIAADGATAALCHYAQETEQAEVFWDVNGDTLTEDLTQDPDLGLWTSEIEVTATVAGRVVVTVEGESVEIEAV